MTLGFHNGMLRVLPPLWDFLKMTMKYLIEIGMLEIRGKISSFSIFGCEICASYWTREDKIEADEVCVAGDLTD